MIVISNLFPNQVNWNLQGYYCVIFKKKGAHSNEYITKQYQLESRHIN